MKGAYKSDSVKSRDAIGRLLDSGAASSAASWQGEEDLGRSRRKKKKIRRKKKRGKKATLEKNGN